MPRKLIIFGNGLGMALDPNHFSLTKALAEMWEHEGLLTDEQKELIKRCTGNENAPESEDELDDLHLAITSCETLQRIGSGEVDWLSEYGQDFPEVTAKYIHKVATYLHNYEGGLPEPFEEHLIQFIKRTKSHVSTLNYDKLLYSSFIENDILKGYNGFLVDGMWARGFASENLERQGSRDFGYYLHLHGSPLFMNDEDTIIKLGIGDLSLDSEYVGKHIVLTHVKHKLEVIAASYALSTYWDYLRFSLSEVQEVILFGYSGLDKHLNKLLRPYNKDIKIIEWTGSGDEALRKRFWKSELGTVPTLIQLEDITTFTDW